MEQQDLGQGFRIVRYQGKCFVFSAIGCFYEVIARRLGLLINRSPWLELGERVNDCWLRNSLEASTVDGQTN
jgi:hypothetical protein